VLLCQHPEGGAKGRTATIAMVPLLVLAGVCWWFVWSFREKLEAMRIQSREVVVEAGPEAVSPSIPLTVLGTAKSQPLSFEQEHGTDFSQATPLPAKHMEQRPGLSHSNSSTSRTTTSSTRSRLEVNFGGLAHTMTTRENARGRESQS
jgi:hypothetical protein